tara:strand:- start:1082 stop:1387 length:306 start_codon:yes stop_codon:yes gene_type:complete
MSDNKNQTDIKKFIIKLAAVTVAVIIIINVTYNLIFADKLENINKILLLNKKENIESVKEKIRSELKKGIEKDQIINEDDRLLFYKFYLKIKEEFKQIENQ